jgi:hypothetical protein
MNLTTKQKERLLFKRDLLEMITDFELTNDLRTVEEIQEMKDYKQYLRDLPQNDYAFKQPPSFFKVNRVYNFLSNLYDQEN